jgi:pSer/pThr/pTyr-binding forkhead associated (FHA) protein
VAPVCAPRRLLLRHHAELCRDGERWLLRDLDSRAGTRLNGMRVLEATEVRPGDRIALGEARYRLGTGLGGSRRA